MEAPAISAERLAAAAHRKLAARQAPPPHPESHRDDHENDPRDKLDHMPHRMLEMRDQSQQQPPWPIVSRSPTAKFTVNTPTVNCMTGKTRFRTVAR
jgi:hypothetical protein